MSAVDAAPVRRAPAIDRNVLFLCAGIAALATAATLANPRFLSTGNLVNLLVQTSYLSIFTLAQTIPLITRGFDLSLGATVSAASLVAALAFGAALGAGPAIAIAAAAGAGLAAGVAMGAVNGGLIAYAGLNPFIVTLATWNILDGIVAILSGGFPIPVDASFGNALYSASVAGMPVPVLLAGVMVVGAWFLLERSSFGRKLYLIGANPAATRLAGIDNRRIVFVAYAMCAMLAAFGALLLTARTGSGEPNLGGALTLQSIAAAVIGGVSLRGGEGCFYSPLLGALFITVLGSALNFLRVESYLQMVVLGALIVVSVCVDQFRRY